MASVKNLLCEAIRRNKNFYQQRTLPLKDQWLGLGTEAVYRSGIKAGFFKFHDGEIPPPRCMGWLVLTDAGIAAMKALPEWKK